MPGTPAVRSSQPDGGRALYVSDLSVSFANGVSIGPVRFQAQPGCIVALVGDNGAGKSTILRAVFGLLPATTGQVLLGRRSIGSQPARRRQHAGLRYLDQGVCVWPRLTFADHLRLARDHRRSSASPSQPDDLLADIGMADVADRPAGEGSYGQKRALQLATLYAAGGSVFLLDEPFAGLSFEATVSVVRLLRRLSNDARAVVLTEHSAAIGYHLAHEVIRLGKGAESDD